MTILHRRLIYLGFILVFLIATPLVVLYTMGYRYNFTKGRVQKTGVLRVTTQPRGADIYLNGVKYEGSQTPAWLEKILPGDYSIRLEKSGYYPWEKKLPVYENGTTFAEKITLWKQAQPQLLSATSADAWLISPDKNIVALTDEAGNVSLMNINSGIFGETSGGNIGNLAEIKGYDRLLFQKFPAFSPSGRFLLTTAIDRNDTASYLIDTVNKTTKKITAKTYKLIKWDQNNDTLYGLTDSGLDQIDTGSLKPKTVTSLLPIYDFYVANNTLYTISGSLNETLSQQTLGDNKSQVIEKLDLDRGSYRIIAVKNRRVIAADQAGNLAIIDLDRRIPTVKTSSRGSSWLSDDMLLYYNDFEIYTYNLSQRDPELITRLGTQLNSAAWHPDGMHLIFSTDGAIKIIELDNREYRNILTIATGTAKFLAADRSGKNLFYSTADGIYKLNLQ